MTTDRAIGLPDPRAETGPATTERATSLLDFDAAVPPPSAPRSVRYPVLTCRVPAHLAAWAHEAAARRGTSLNGYLNELIAADRAGLPADCRHWLATMAAQLGYPGETDRALVAVLRHLAARWPDGARLDP